MFLGPKKLSSRYIPGFTIVYVLGVDKLDVGSVIAHFLCMKLHIFSVYGMDNEILHCETQGNNQMPLMVEREIPSISLVEKTCCRKRTGI